MSLAPAERAGLVGGVLLAGGLVTAAILYFWPHRPPGPPVGPDRPAVGTAAERPPEEPAPPEPLDPERETRVSALRAEISRLREKLQEKDEEIEVLRARLEAAGVPAEEPRADPAEVAEAAIRELWRCGPETAPADVEELVGRIVSAGKEAAEPVLRALGIGRDVALADAWMYTGGRFTAHPTLRVAFLDALRRLTRVPGAEVEAQSALVTALRGNEDPLEICLLAGYLEGVRDVPVVETVLEERARRFLDLPPFKREGMLVAPLLRVLAGLPPEEAASALLAFLEPSAREPLVARIALGLIARLPAESALPALARAAADAGLGEKALAAAEFLAARPGPEVVEVLAEVLPGLSPEARRAVYVKIADPARAALDRLRRAPQGLGALDDLEGLVEEVAARKAFLLARSGEETDPRLSPVLKAARRRLEKIEQGAAEVRRRLEGR